MTGWNDDLPSTPERQFIHFSTGKTIQCGVFKVGMIATTDPRKVNCPECLKLMLAEKAKEVTR